MSCYSGVGIIPKDEIISERQYKKVMYFAFNMITKDPYADGVRQWIRVSVSVPSEFVEKARKAFSPGKCIQIRLGEVKGIRKNKGPVFMTINSRWKWTEVLETVTPGPERKSYEDV